MMIALSGRQIELLDAYARECEDAEQVGDDWTMDIYDMEPPLSIEFEFREGGIDVLALCTLGYDAGLDGWHILTRIESEQDIKKMLLSWPLLDA